jgi:ATP-dependent Lon protease
VLTVGGVKEKILGAHRAGIHRIILPSRNQRDIAEVPASVKRKLSFLYVDHMDQVLEEALLSPPEKKPRRSSKQRGASSEADSAPAAPQ